MKTTTLLLAGAAALTLAACGDNRDENMPAETTTGMDATTTAPVPPADTTMAPAPSDSTMPPAAGSSMTNEPVAPGQTPPTLPPEPAPDGMGTPTTPPAR
ncbi:MAG: hypothetical protein ACK4I0_04020 [Brevundimonas sp.]|uniref:hypothetical protein n=1 Tax=Brevundimonas sp. TaxID=1871086 RepID=UPI00391A36BD